MKGMAFQLLGSLSTSFYGPNLVVSQTEQIVCNFCNQSNVNTGAYLEKKSWGSGPPTNVRGNFTGLLFLLANHSLWSSLTWSTPESIPIGSHLINQQEYTGLQTMLAPSLWNFREMQAFFFQWKHLFCPHKRPFQFMSWHRTTQTSSSQQSPSHKAIINPATLPKSFWHP